MTAIVGKLWQGTKNMMDINKATLSGAIDILVVEQPDGTFKCVRAVPICGGAL